MATNSAPYKSDPKKLQDIPTEWSALAALLNPDNAEYVSRLTPMLFTGNRIDVFYAMQSAYIEFDTISFEGLNKHLEGNVPGELFNTQGRPLRPIISELARLARKRLALQKSALFKDLSDVFDPSIDDLHSAMEFEPVLPDEDSSTAIGFQSLLTDLEKKRSGDYKFAKTGLRFLDAAMGGEWKEKSLVIYMGGPGTAKTTLAAQSMLAMAEGYDLKKEKVITPSLFISLEMAKDDLAVKWLGNSLDIDTTYIQNGQLTEEQLESIKYQSVYLQKLPMYVIDNGEITLGQMMYEIRRHVYNKKVRVVFIDYLQIVNHHKKGNTNDDLGDFSIAMKSLAKRENITIVILSQITPGKDGAFKIRDSGEVGAVADVIIYASIEDPDEPGPMKSLNVRKEKNRFGPTGKTTVLFNGPYQRIEEGSL